MKLLFEPLEVFTSNRSAKFLSSNPLIHEGMNEISGLPILPNIMYQIFCFQNLVSDTNPTLMDLQYMVLISSDQYRFFSLHCFVMKLKSEIFVSEES